MQVISWTPCQRHWLTRGQHWPLAQSRIQSDDHWILTEVFSMKDANGWQLHQQISCHMICPAGATQNRRSTGQPWEYLNICIRGQQHISDISIAILIRLAVQNFCSDVCRSFWHLWTSNKIIFRSVFTSPCQHLQLRQIFYLGLTPGRPVTSKRQDHINSPNKTTKFTAPTCHPQYPLSHTQHCSPQLDQLPTAHCPHLVGSMQPSTTHLLPYPSS